MVAKSSSKAKKPNKPASPPPQRKCGCMSMHYWLVEQFPQYRIAQTEIEHNFMAARRVAKTAPKKPYTISVVVHLLQAPGGAKITTSQVNAQLKTLNQDFRAQNFDRKNVPPVWKGLVADAMVEFQLATKDPSGIATSGVIYAPTNEIEFGQNDSIKDPSRGGSAAWPTDRYLNVWVGPLKDGLLGYAQFPGGPVDTDGVVISINAFGSGGTAVAPFNKGRTCTHEVGHYLNLRHIWGDTPDCSGGDSINDTPNAEGPNYGIPTFPKVTCQNGPNGDMFMNYMDYVDDEAMFMFTPEQVARMQATLDGPRRSLWS
ncbi:Pregnancy-associated plasma protein-A [Acidovorax sp. CF316]|uniref:zinc metalloprotease n=1 Tax=Acidovorax sp. CF316 TaxID=1144317 RepID=UPI00026BE2F7|nr:zinc metalloprotease [Acidovorax sp. CF316]EJE48789.1 Pregnancy-associated plasma protein-A [Acidovorax sp. CF316]